MEALIETFQLDIKLVVAQFINFGIVLAVLWFFALKPLMKIMDDRTNTIEKSLKKAEQIEKDFESLKVKEGEVLGKAQKEAQVILSETKKVAEVERARLKDQTKQEIATIVADAKKKITLEKNKASEELKSEVAALVLKATEKVLGEKAPKSIDKKLLDEVIKELS